MLKKWHAHYRAVTCLVFSEDDSLLISGSEDGSVRVWSLFMYLTLILFLLLFPFLVSVLTIMAYASLFFLIQWFRIFDDLRSQEANNLYEHSFSEHTLRVTDIAIGYGGCNATIVSASEDRTCKVWFTALCGIVMVSK